MTTSSVEHTSAYSLIRNSSGNDNMSTSHSSEDDPFLWHGVFTDPFETVVVLLHMSLCGIMLFGSTMTLWAMSKDNVLKKNIQNKYIMSLAAADQMMGTSHMQLIMKNYFLTDNLWIGCQPNLVMIYTSTAVGLLNMLTIAIDRYVYIVHPFVHMRHVTGRRISALIFVQWTLAALYGAIPIYVFDAGQSKGCNPFATLQRKFVVVSHPIFFFIDCFGIGITYGLIAKVARQHYTRKNKRAQQIKAVIENNAKPTKETVQTNIYKYNEEETVIKSGQAMQREIIDYTSVDFISSISKSGDESYGRPTKNLESNERNECTRNSKLSSDNNNSKGNKASVSFEEPCMSKNKFDEDIHDSTNYTGNETPSDVTLTKDKSDETISDVTLTKDEQSNETINDVTFTLTKDEQSNETISDVTLTKDEQRDETISDVTLTKDEQRDETIRDVTLTKDEQRDETIRDVTLTKDEQRDETISDVTLTKDKRNKTISDVTLTKDNRSDGFDKKSNRLETTSHNDITIDLESKTQKYVDNCTEKNIQKNVESVAEIHLEFSKQADMPRTSISTSGAFKESYLNNTTTNASINSAPLEQTDQGQQEQQISPWNIQSLRWMKQMIVVFGLFFVCWTPSMVCIFLSISYEPNHKVVYILSLFGMSNSAVNFFVYSLYNNTFRAAMKRLVCSCFG